MAQDTEKLKRSSYSLIVGCVVLIAAIGGYRYYQIVQERRRLNEEANLGPHVQVVTPSKSNSVRTVNLVGEALPYASVTLYAKVSGYLKTVNVDKGDVVKKDQLLAVIESPEIDKDYQGALADAKNKKSIAGRMTTLRARNLVSPQEADQADSDNDMAKSRLDSLAVQKSYEVLRAPFAGTVTSRYADPGALVQNAANSQTSALPVVTVAQVDRLRVYVYVDQRDAAYIQLGGPAQVKVAERPDLDLSATVTRVSGELDQKTKMLLTEIDIENKNHQLVPGSFVQVSLVLHTPEWLQAPISALLVMNGKNMMAVVDSEDHIHFREVKVSDNDGQMVTILSGVQAGETVAANLGTNIADGSHIRPLRLTEAAKPPPSSDVKPVSTTPAAATAPDAKPAADASVSIKSTSESSEAKKAE